MSRGNDDIHDNARVDDFTKLVEYVGVMLWPKQPVKCVRSVCWPDDGDDWKPHVAYEARRDGDGAKNVTFSFSGPAICDMDMVTIELTSHFDPALFRAAQ